MSENTVSLLYDHYKETCSIISEAIKRRDRLMVLVVIALGFFTFQTFFPTSSNSVVNDFLNFKFGLSLKLSLSVIGNVIWFLLLLFTLRYFQIAVFVERQYSYIHQVEERLNKEVGEDLIVRESKAYLKKYPMFSDWMWALYTIIFPLLLLLLSTIKIGDELKNICITGLSFGLIFNIFIFILLTTSIFLYLLAVHKNKN